MWAEGNSTTRKWTRTDSKRVGDLYSPFAGGCSLIILFHRPSTPRKYSEPGHDCGFRTSPVRPDPVRSARCPAVNTLILFWRKPGRQRLGGIIGEIDRANPSQNRLRADFVNIFTNYDLT